MFADLVGSTSLAEREDAEVVQSVVGRAFDRLSEEVQRYEGLLEKFMGDAVLAVFGVPRAHEDDAERAVRAAMEMQAVLSELNRGFAAEGKPQLAMRIGVEAGEVLVDVDRARGPRDRMLTGDAVNTAARLQTAAEPSRVVVGPAVFAATKDVIEYRELPALELKGKAEPVPAWGALRVKAKQRGERPQLGMEAKLVGRDEELAVLKQTFRRVQTEGRPALVTVVAPAGVGKSRLVRELERYVEGLREFIYWRRGRCLAYGNTSYSALADAFKAGRNRGLVAKGRDTNGSKPGKAPLLEVRDLHVSVGNNEILKGVDLDVNEGEVHAVMGPNGSGKSTLAAILAGKDGYQVTEGEVLYRGKNLLELEPDARAPVRALGAVRRAAIVGRRQAQRRFHLPRAAHSW